MHFFQLSQQVLGLLLKIKRLGDNRDLVFPGDHRSIKPMSEKTIKTVLRMMNYDTKTGVCGHVFLVMTCSNLIALGL